MPTEQRKEYLPTSDSGSDESWYVFGGGAELSNGYSPENLEEERPRSGKGGSH